jgi:hypothetical protein
MLENLLSVFLTVKFPLSNSAYISGCFFCNASISRR